MYNDDQRQIEQLEKELAETHKLLEQYKKEQDASIIVFNRQNEQLEKVNQSNSDLREENKILKQTIKEQKQDITDLKKKIKENQQTIEDLEKKEESQIKEILEVKKNNRYLSEQVKQDKEIFKQFQKHNNKLVEDYTSLEANYLNTKNLFNQTQQELTSEQEKNKLLETEIEEFSRKVEELELKKPPKTFQTHSVQTEINSFNKSPIVSKKTNMANVSEGLAYQ